MVMKNNQQCGIYRITCMGNLRTYFGSTNNFRKRKIEHTWRLNKGVHVNPLLQNAWNKYGKSSLIFQFIEEVDESCLLDREQVYLDFLFANDKECRFNINPHAAKPPGVSMKGKDNPRFGKKLSDEQRKNLSIANSVPKPYMSEVARQSNKTRVVGKGYQYKKNDDAWEVRIRGVYYGFFKLEADAALVAKQVREDPNFVPTRMSASEISERTRQRNKTRVWGKGYQYNKKEKVWVVQIRGVYYGRFKQEADAALVAKQVRDTYKESYYE